MGVPTRAFVCLVSLLCANADYARSQPHVFQRDRDDGRRAAVDLGKLLPGFVAGRAASAAAPMTTQTIVGASGGDDDKAIREQLLRSQKLFNAASSGDLTSEEKAVEADLASALASPAKLGKPPTVAMAVGSDSCQPDLTTCPVKFTQQGASCLAPPEYTGPCASEMDLSGMNFEQKLAVAKQCQVEFPCQGDCAQDFAAVCPSAWREVDAGVCEAPAAYSGICARLLDVSGMSERDKHAFGVACGARWSCKSPAVECARDYASPCPAGWSKDGVHCNAPATYKACSPCQRFDGMSPAEKQDWEQLCHASFPCLAQRGVAGGVLNNGTEKVSFLAAQTIPVDGYKIRNSLYLTQPMRTPASASVNVIMKEDVATALDAAKYKGMQGQIESLMDAFEDGLKQLR